MRFRTLTWTRFRGATPGAAHAYRAWPTREGLRVLVEDEDGRLGQGEACPLPGYSPDDVDAAARALATVTVRDFSPEPGAVLCALSGLRSPSARFALETALLDVLGQQRQAPLASLLGLRDPRPRPAAFLVSAEEPAGVRTAVRRGVEAGFSTFKVKVGAPGRFALDRARLEAAQEALPSGGRLRADANRGYDDDALPARLDALASFGLEWLEEPAPARRLAALGRVPVPIALDESLADEREGPATARLFEAGCVAAAVVKPAVLGGLFPALRTAERAARYGVPSVVSHLFDGPIAYAACVALACRLEVPRGWGPARGLAPDAGGPGEGEVRRAAGWGPAHGLAPHAGLEPWPAAPVRVDAGRLRPSTDPGLGIPLLALPSGGVA